MDLPGGVEWLERYSVVLLPVLVVAEQVGIPLPAVTLGCMLRWQAQALAGKTACSDRPIGHVASRWTAREMYG